MPKKVRKKRTCKKPGRKGGAWERQASTLLSLWISKSYGDSRDDLVWRSAGSGSRATASKKKGISREAHAGDIVTTDARAVALCKHFMFECKFYKNLNLQGLFWGLSSAPIDICIDAPIELAMSYGKWPMLLLKQNQRTPLVVLPFKVAAVATKLSGILPWAQFARTYGKFAVFTLPDLFENLDYQRFIEQVPPYV